MNELKMYTATHVSARMNHLQGHSDTKKYRQTNNQISFVYESPWRWLMRAETCIRVYILS